jgi:hypothetical protein
MRNLNEVKEIKKLNRYNPSPKVDRTYITLKGADQTYRGDANTKIYINNLTGELAIEKASKGLTSRAFDASLAAFKAEMGI